MYCVLHPICVNTYAPKLRKVLWNAYHSTNLLDLVELRSESGSITQAIRQIAEMFRLSR